MVATMIAKDGLGEWNSHREKLSGKVKLGTVTKKDTLSISEAIKAKGIAASDALKACECAQFCDETVSKHGLYRKTVHRVNSNLDNYFKALTIEHATLITEYDATPAADFVEKQD